MRLIGSIIELSGNNLQLARLFNNWIIVMLSAALICFLVSEITRNYSQVDKLWSLMPLIYGIMTLSAFPSARIWIMCLLISIWGFRLSYNFYRKGGYKIIPWRGEEDYRWKFIRQSPILKGRIRFGLFNLLFISFYQHFLIFLFSTPLLLAAKNQGTNLTFVDIVAAGLMLTFIIVESVADNQLHRFQNLKRSKLPSEGFYRESVKNGFLSEGLWQYARHPNFTAEQAVWISFYLFGVAASGKWINLTIAGPALLVLLFLGSSELTEHINSRKYPAYSDYKKEVPRFLPKIFSK